MKTTDQVALNDWYAIATASELTAQPVKTRLLGQDIEYRISEGGAPLVREILDDGARGPALPVQVRYGCLFTSLGTPVKDIVHIEEAEEEDRRFVPCGWGHHARLGPGVWSKTSSTWRIFPSSIPIFSAPNPIPKSRPTRAKSAAMWTRSGPQTAPSSSRASPRQKTRAISST